MLIDRMRTLRDVKPAWSAVVITLALAVCHVASPRCVAQETSRREGADRDRTIHSRIDDRAGLFSASAIESARKELERIERETHVETTIQTVESLEGKTASAAAFHHVRESRLEGLYILIAKEEHAIETLVSRKYLKILTPEKQKAVRAAITESFKKQDFDGGLKKGVAMIAQETSGLAQDWGLPEITASSRGGAVSQPVAERVHPGDSPLIVRNQVRLSLAGAKAIIAAAGSKAVELKLKLNVAVVDDGGHLVAFERMDGARPASLYTAMTKATSAATFRQATGPLASGSTPADPLLNVSLQNAAEASGGKITALKGGVPVTVDGQIIGAVGIAGGTGEQDAEVAQAGVKGFMDQLAASVRVEKEEEKPKP